MTEGRSTAKGQLALLQRLEEVEEEMEEEAEGCLMHEQGEPEGGGGAELEASRWSAANNGDRQMQPQRAATTHTTHSTHYTLTPTHTHSTHTLQRTKTRRPPPRPDLCEAAVHLTATRSSNTNRTEGDPQEPEPEHSESVHTQKSHQNQNHHEEKFYQLV